jgi:hypothetical protein
MVLDSNRYKDKTIEELLTASWWNFLFLVETSPLDGGNEVVSSG